jgi:mRNA interferase MazF
MTELGHGQVWWVDLERDKQRPVVVLTRSRIAPLLRRVLVAPVTSKVRGIATEVPLGIAEGLLEGSVANLDNAQLVPVDRFLHQTGEVAHHRWPEFCVAMGRVMSCRTRG